MLSTIYRAFSLIDITIFFVIMVYFYAQLFLRLKEDEKLFPVIDLQKKYLCKDFICDKCKCGTQSD